MVRKISFYKTFFLIFCASLLVFSPASAKLSQDKLEFFAQNNILFYDPTGVDCNYSTSSYDGNPSAGLSDIQAAFVDQYHDIAANLSIEYGIPWETVMAQGILESASGTSTFATERNNFFGIGAFDSNPNNAFSYANPTDGWRGYYENIKNTPTYRNHGVFVGEAITNPYIYAQAIKDAGYATDPNYVNKLNTLIAAIENRSAEKGWDSSQSLATAHPEMLTNAANNASGSTTQGVISTNTCIASGDGSINNTAIMLSWPDRSHSPDDPKPEYRTALQAQTDISTLQVGDTCSQVGKSCDAFVVTVLRYSGVDPNAPCCGAANLLNYFSSHSDLYEEIPNIGNSSNMQPGDIRSSSSHVEIYVQLSDGSYKIASASHCNRTADHYGSYYSDSSYKIFRKK